MIGWDPPRTLTRTALVHLSKCRRATITEDESLLDGEPHTFVVSIASDPARVHGTLSSLDDAKEYVELFLVATVDELRLCTCWRTPDGEEVRPPDCPRHAPSPSKGGGET